MHPSKPKVWGKMLKPSWDTLSVTGVSRGRGAKYRPGNPEGVLPTPASPFLPAPSCSGSLPPDVQQFLQGVPQICPDMPGSPGRGEGRSQAATASAPCAETDRDARD